MSSEPAGVSARRFGGFPRAEMNESQQAVNDGLVSFLYPDRAGTDVVIGGPMEALLHSAPLADSTGHMVKTMFTELSLPRDVTELAILLTARHWDCAYEFETHRRYALSSGLDVSIIDAIEIGESPRELSPVLLDVQVFVTELLTSGDVTDSSFEKIAKQLGKRGAAELIAVVGFYIMLAFVLKVDRLPIERDGKPWSLPVRGSA